MRVTSSSLERFERLVDAADGGRRQRAPCRLHRFVRAFFEESLANGPQLYFGEHSYLNEGQRAAIDTWADRLTVKVQAMIETGLADGSIAPCEPELVVQLLLGMFIWLAKWVPADEPPSVDRMTAAVEACVLRGLAIDALAAATKRKRTCPGGAFARWTTQAVVRKPCVRSKKGDRDHGRFSAQPVVLSRGLSCRYVDCRALLATSALAQTVRPPIRRRPSPRAARHPSPRRHSPRRPIPPRNRRRPRRRPAAGQRGRRDHRHRLEAPNDAAGHADLGLGDQRRDDSSRPRSATSSTCRPSSRRSASSRVSARRAPTSSSAASATARATPVSSRRSASSSTASTARARPPRSAT